MKILILSFVIFLTACSSGASRVEQSFYLLGQVPSESQNIADQRQVYVTPVVLPDHLNRNQLVMRSDSNQLIVANYHQWGNDLSQEVQAVLIRRFNFAFSDVGFVKHCQTCPTITTYIDHFYPTQSGDVVLEGKYRIESDGDVRHQGFFFSSTLDSGGYDEAVGEMRELLFLLAEQITADPLLQGMK